MKKFGIFFLLAAMLFASVPVTAETADKISIYVSPQGNDGNSGTIEKPLKTLDSAKTVARRYIKSGMPVEVIFRGGEYRINNTVNFTQEDSGTPECPVVYKSYNDEQVIFKGSVPLNLEALTNITDKEVLKRIHPNAQGKVMELDLKASGIKQDQLFDNINFFVNSTGKLNSGEPNTLYIDDKELEIAHWPNGRKSAKFNLGDDAYSLKYAENDPDRWGEAKGWWVDGYLMVDYRKIRTKVKSIDTGKKMISIYEQSADKVNSYFSRRWQAWNLLEELDLPGEYYIDRENMKLYFYPPYTLKGAKAELSVLANDMISITDAHDITFRGLEFTQTRNMVFNMINVDNIDFIGNKFYNLASGAIWCYGEYYQTAKGYKPAQTDATYWQRQIIDCSYNCDIKDNLFYMLGGSAVCISGGNVDILKPSNNVIENNLILRTSQRYFQNGQAVELYGCGNVLRKNEFGGIPHQAVFMLGNDHLIEYNEFYDVLQETSDSGVIYRGQGLNGRGINASYNYFHDCNAAIDLPHPWQNAIYWDGWQQGCIAEHNIIYNVPTAHISNNIDYQIHRYNVAVDCSFAPNRFTQSSTELKPVTMDTMFIDMPVGKFYNELPNKEIYFEKYPELKAFYEGTPNVVFTKVDENLTVGGGKDQIGGYAQKFAKSWTKNIRTEDKSIFVDPENQDFRLKSDSDIAKQMPHLLNESFDLNEIGYQKDIEFNEKTSPFRLLYPANGQEGISDYKVQLSWEQAFGAMTYRLVIAKDPELKDIVYDKTGAYYSATIDELEANTRYYWKVYASSRGRKHVNTWESDGAVYTFTTGLHETLDVAAANSVIAEAQALIPKIHEGDKVGEYAPGTTKTLKDMSERINTLLKLPEGTVNRTQLQKQVATLNNKIQNGGMNTGFVNLADYFKPECWDERVKGKLHIKDGELTLYHDWLFEIRDRLEGENIAGTNCLGDLAGSVVYCFDAYLHLGTEALHGFADMITFGQNLETTQIQWSSPNLGYFNCGGAWGTGIMRSNGTTYVGLNHSDSILKYDQTQSIRFGIIRTSIGSYVVYEIDGDPGLSLADIETIFTVPLEFVMANRSTGGYIKLTETKNMPTKEEADILWKKARYMLVEAIHKRYDEFVENAILMKRGGTKIVTGDGVIDITDNPPEMVNGQLAAPYDALAKALKMAAERNGNEITLSKQDVELKFTIDSNQCTVNGAAHDIQAAPKEKNGTVMLAMEDLKSLLNMQVSYYDVKSGLYMFGDSGYFSFQDQALVTTRSIEMFDELARMDDKVDIKYDDFKKKK